MKSKTQEIDERRMRDCAFLLAGAAVVYITFAAINSLAYRPVTYDMAVVNDALSRIDSGCNDLFVVRCLDSNGYCNFVKRCVSDDYCKSVYIPIEECMNEQD